jgi:hypothetical protein
MPANIRGQDTNDLILLVVDRDASPDYVRVSAEATLPKIVTDYYDLRLTGLPIVWSEGSTLNRFHTE